MGYACQGWEGGGGVSISCFNHMHVMLPRPAYYRACTHWILKETKFSLDLDIFYMLI